ncbi:MAG: Ig-like domain-containing protein [Clostridia bacterium]
MKKILALAFAVIMLMTLVPSGISIAGERRNLKTTDNQITIKRLNRNASEGEAVKPGEAKDKAEEKNAPLNFKALAVKAADPAVNAALNVPNGTLEFENDEAHPFAVTIDGERECVKSTLENIDDTEAFLTLNAGTLYGGSSITWDWKASCESFSDKMNFYCNGVRVTEIYGEQDWSSYTFDITSSGDYSFQWSYSKDMSVPGGLDCTWLDNVAITATLPAPVESITIEPETRTMMSESFYTLVATVLPINAVDSSVIWSSSDERIVTVDETGLIHSLVPGFATITATTVSGALTAKSEITVIERITPISHTEMDYSTRITKGGHYDMTFGIGTSEYIYVPDYSGVGSSENETFAKGFSIELDAIEGANIQIVNDIDTMMWIFDSSFNLLAFNDDGPVSSGSSINFTAPKAGIYNVLVMSYSYSTEGDATMEVSNYDPLHVESIELALSSLYLGIGRTAQLSYTVLPEDADVLGVTCLSSDPNVVAIENESGLIKGVSSGTSEVTIATLDGGFTASIIITVGEPLNPEYDGLIRGYNLYDDMGLNEGFFKTTKEKPEELETTCVSDLRIEAAEYYNGLLYCYSYIADAYDEIITFFVIDPATWTAQKVSRELKDSCTEMAYDYLSERMFGLALNRLENIIYLTEVDMDTGDLDFIAPIDLELGGYPSTLACDNNGQLYTIANNGNLYKMDKYSGETSFISYLGATADYIQATTFDFEEGLIYWTQVSDAEGSNLVAIDPENGAIVSKKTLGCGFTQVTGAYIYVDPADVQPTIDPIPLIGMTFENTELTLRIGKTSVIVPVYTPKNATNRDTIWESNNEAIATVDARGNISGINPGSCYVTAKTVDGGFKARALVTVTPMPDSDLNHGFVKLTLSAGDVFQLGDGYQMFISSDLNAIGTIIPSWGPYPEGDVDPATIDQLDYTIPPDADGLVNSTHIVVNSVCSIIIPEGTYDMAIVNPTPRDNTVWVARNGLFDDMVLTEGNEYFFHMRLDGGLDTCDTASEFLGFIGEGPEYKTVTFNDMDDTFISAMMVEKGADAIEPTPPVHEGYEFKGWDNEFINVQSDITVKACYEYTGILGDVNIDGEVNSGDAALILRYAAILDSLSMQQLQLADYNNDGDVNSGDASAILRMMVNL